MTTFCTYLPMSVEGEKKEKLIFLHASTLRTSLILPPTYVYIHDMLITIEELAFFFYQQQSKDEKDVVVCLLLG